MKQLRDLHQLSVEMQVIKAADHFTVIDDMVQNDSEITRTLKQFITKVQALQTVGKL